MRRVLTLIWKQFWWDESGQDLVEYSLLMALVALCAVGLFPSIRTTTSQLWTTLNLGLSSAQAAAS